MNLRKMKLKNLITGITIVALSIATLGVGAVNVANAANTVNALNDTAQTNTSFHNTPLHRVYNPNSGEHLFLVSTSERDWLVSLGWVYEGVGWMAPGTYNPAMPDESKWTDVDGLTPIYRCYNPNSGEHIYLKSVAEKDWLVSLGWNDEGICWYTDEATGDDACGNVYRVYNPNANGGPGSHMYLTNRTEKDWLVSLGWNDEDVAFMSAHDNEVTGVKAANCAENGYTGDAKCKICGHTHKGSIIPANGEHELTNLKNVKEATCISEGYSGDGVCKICGAEVKGKVIPKNDNHKHVTHTDALISVVTDGYYSEHYCDTCGEMYCVSYDTSPFETWDCALAQHYYEKHGFKYSGYDLQRAYNDYTVDLDDTDVAKETWALPEHAEYINEPVTYTQILAPEQWHCEDCGKDSTDGINWVSP